MPSREGKGETRDGDPPSVVLGASAGTDPAALESRRLRDQALALSAPGSTARGRRKGSSVRRLRLRRDRSGDAEELERPGEPLPDGALRDVHLEGDLREGP